jgi:hypothetical protein
MWVRSQPSERNLLSTDNTTGRRPEESVGGKHEKGAWSNHLGRAKPLISPLLSSEEIHTHCCTDESPPGKRENTMKNDNKIAKEISIDFVKVLADFGVHNIVLKYKIKGDDGYLEQEDKEFAFAVKVNYPYRDIEFFISEKGIKIKQAKDNYMYKVCLYHEAFHILHARYSNLAQNRYTNEKELDDEEEQLADTFATIIMNLI